jgi:hypothetical protein
MWFSIGSKLAVVSDGLVVIRLKGRLLHDPVQLTVDPVRVYWASRQVPDSHVETALFHDEPPAFDQYMPGSMGRLERLGSGLLQLLTPMSNWRGLSTVMPVKHVAAVDPRGVPSPIMER